MAVVSPLLTSYCLLGYVLVVLQVPKSVCLREGSVFSLKREKERENMLLAGRTSVINFCSSFVSEYVWAHMLDYKAM